MNSEIKSYAGLLPIRNVSQMFFWYFPKASDKLIIWLQGGPGSSSMIGLFYEMGPIQIRQGMLAWNPDSWDGSMLFIDNPVGTGFSFVNGSIEIARRNVTSLEELERRAANLPSDCVPQDTTKEKAMYKHGFACNMDAVASDLVDFLDQFYHYFPKESQSALYITGESYAGKYVPALAHKIHFANQVPGRKKINLAGVAIGNGLTDPYTQVKYHGRVGLAFGLLSEESAKLIDHCADLARRFICDGNYLLAGDARMWIFDIFDKSTGNVNYYDVRRVGKYNRTEMYHLLRLKETVKALNLPEGTRFEKDPNVHGYLEQDLTKSAAPYFTTLLNNKYKVLLYQGQFDFRDGVYGSTEWINAISWEHQASFNSAERLVWFPKGYVTKYNNLIRVELLGAGHLAPGDAPSNCKEMINKFLLA